MRVFYLRSTLLRLQFLFLIFVCYGHSFGQTGLVVEATATVSTCDTIHYNVRYAAINDSETSLVVRFNQRVQALGENLNTEDLVDRIEVPLPATTCQSNQLQISVLAPCVDQYTTLQTNLEITSAAAGAMSSATLETLIDVRTATLVSGDVSLQSQQQTLERELIIYNTSLQEIDFLSLGVRPNSDFAIWIMSSMGTMQGDNLIIDADDITAQGYSNGKLLPGDSLVVDLTFDLNNCDFDFIEYSVQTGCRNQVCGARNILIDDNANLQPLLYRASIVRSIEEYGEIVNFPNTSPFQHWQRCEYDYVSDTAFLVPQSSISTIEEARNIKLQLNDDRRRGEPWDCFRASVRIGAEVIEAEADQEGNIVLDFEEFTTDPDGQGGLQDLDGDGRYNDLRIGDTLIYEVGVIALCEDDVIDGDIDDTTFDLRYENFCGEPFVPITYSTVLRKEELLSAGIVAFDEDYNSVSNSFHYKFGQIVLNSVVPENYSLDCTDEMLDITIVLDDGLVWDESRSISALLASDSTTYQVSDVQQTDRELRFSIPASAEYIVRVPFEFAINRFDIDLPDRCTDCIEMPEPYRTNVSYTVDCSNETCSYQIGNDDILPLLRSGQSFSARLDSVAIIDAEPYQIRKLTPGWVDSLRSARVDLSDTLYATNNIYMFETDTVRLRVPFRINCRIDGQATTFQYNIVNELNNSRLEVVSSTIGEMGNNGVLMNTCDFTEITNMRNQSVTMRLSDQLLTSACLASDDTLYWDLVARVRMDGELNASASFNSIDLDFSVAEEKSGGCRVTTNKHRRNLLIHQHFRSSIYSPLQFSPSEVTVGQPVNITFWLYQGLSSSSQAPEYVELPMFDEFTINVPDGLTLVDDQLRLRIQTYDRPIRDSILYPDGRYRVFTVGFEASTEFIDLQLVNSGPSPTVDNATAYTFRWAGDEELIIRRMDANIDVVGVLEPICVDGEQDEYDIPVTASINYLDLNNGNEDLLTHDYVSVGIPPLIVRTPLIELSDDFEVLDTDTASWDVVVRQLDDYTLQFRGVPVDSLTVTGGNFFTFIRDTATLIPDQNGRVDINETDIDIGTLDNFFRFYTSEHDCGYDTLYIDYGFTDRFDRSVCDADITTDTIITYIPEPLPLMRWRERPVALDFCEPTTWDIEFSNLGTGDLIAPKVIVTHELEATESLSFAWIDADGQELNIPNEQIQFVGQDRIEIELNDDLQGVERRAITQVLRMQYQPTCDQIQDPISFDFWIAGVNTCGDAIESNALEQRNIPLAAKDDQVYDIQVSLSERDVCSDQLLLEIIITGDGTARLVDNALLVDLPQEVNVSPLSVAIDGVPFNDPSIENLTADGRQSLRWNGIVSDNQQVDSIVLEAILDASCADICGSIDIAAFLQAEAIITCDDGATCQQVVTRASLESTSFLLRPMYELRNWAVDIIAGPVNAMSQRVDFEVEVLANSANSPTQIGYFVFVDENSNGAYDSAETILDSAQVSKNSVQDSAFQISASISASESQLCDLYLAIDNCECPAQVFKISLDNESAGTLGSLSVCPGGELLLFGPEWGRCDRMWDPHPRIDLSDGVLAPVYRPQAGVQRDTLVTTTRCGNCDETSIIIVNVEGIQGAIRFESMAPVRCGQQGTVTAVLSHNRGVDEGLQFQWSFSNVNSTTAPNAPEGNVSVTITDESGCSSVISGVAPAPIDGGGSTQNIEIQATPMDSEGREYVVSFTSDSVLIPSRILWRTSAGQLSCADCPTSNLNIEENSTLFLEVIDSTGCRYTDNMTLMIEETPVDTVDQSRPRYFIPNIFSPNQDEVHNLFAVHHNDQVLGVQAMHIYDRWGGLVYERESSTGQDNIAWDGTANGIRVQPGVYVYSVDILLSDNTVIKEKGNVTLIR